VKEKMQNEWVGSLWMPGKIMSGCFSSFSWCSSIEPKPVVNLPWHFACHWFLGTNYILWGCRKHEAHLQNPHPVVSYYSNREHYQIRKTNPSLPYSSNILKENSPSFHLCSSNFLKIIHTMYFYVAFVCFFPLSPFSILLFPDCFF
jgi:hypothetical protein